MLVSKRNRTAEFVVCALFALLLTAVIIRYSLRQGRLSLVPTFDDVGYMADGAARLQHLYDFGVLAFVAEYRRNPPHSPYSDLLAMAAFAVFGIKDWAPYAANSLLALAIFMGANALLPAIRLWQRVLCLLILATVPFTGLAVHEFRPDFCVCFLTALGIMLALTRPFVPASPRRKLAIGAVFGAAMVVKTSFFPATVVYFFAILLLATLRDRIVLGRLGFARIARGWLTCLLPFVLIPLPHYLIAHRMIVDYIREAFVGGHRGVWVTHGGLGYHLAYYLTGPGGQFTMGAHLMLLAAILFVATLAVVARRSRMEIVTHTMMLVALVMAYFQVTLSPVKSPYYGVTLPMLLALEALYWLGQLLDREQRGGWRFGWATALAVIAVGWGACIFRWPPGHQGGNDPVVAARNALVFAVYHDVLNHTITPVPGSKTPDSTAPIGSKIISNSPKVVFNSIGDVNPSLFIYLSYRDRTMGQWIQVPDVDDPRPYHLAWENADFVIASESGTGVIADFLLSSRIQDQLLADLQARKDFKQIGKYPFITTRRSVYVFQRLYFDGFTPISGLDDTEGPLPELNDHVARWGLGPATKLKIRAPEAGLYELTWKARAAVKEQMITVRLDQIAVGQAAVPAAKEFIRSTIAMQLPEGDHDLTLEYSVYNSGGKDPRPMAVLFEELRVNKK